jgi:hypothetical protein
MCAATTEPDCSRQRDPETMSGDFWLITFPVSVKATLRLRLLDKICNRLRTNLANYLDLTTCKRYTGRRFNILVRSRTTIHLKGEF